MSHDSRWFTNANSRPEPEVVEYVMNQSLAPSFLAQDIALSMKIAELDLHLSSATISMSEASAAIDAFGKRFGQILPKRMSYNTEITESTDSIPSLEPVQAQDADTLVDFDGFSMFESLVTQERTGT